MAGRGQHGASTLTKCSTKLVRPRCRMYKVGICRELPAQMPWHDERAPAPPPRLRTRRGLLKAPSMRCPFCGHSDTKVTDSRESDDGIRRRRECLDCGRRFTTYERVQAAPLSSSRRTAAARTSPARRCARHPALLRQAAHQRRRDRRHRRRHRGDAQRPRRARGAVTDVGDLVMERLRELSHVAYVRFAAHYRDFSRWTRSSSWSGVHRPAHRRRDAPPAAPAPPSRRCCRRSPSTRRPPLQRPTAGAALAGTARCWSKASASSRTTAARSSPRAAVRSTTTAAASRCARSSTRRSCSASTAPLRLELDDGSESS